MIKHPLSIAVSGFGFLVICVATIRWIIFYNDLSQFLIFGGIGGVFVLSGYGYYWVKKAEDKMNKLDGTIEELRKIIIKMEWDNK